MNDSFLIRKSVTKAIVYRNDVCERLLDAIWNDPNALVDSGHRLIDKKCVRTTVRIEYEDHTFVIKRHLERSWRHFAKQCFSISRAAKCWNDTWYLIGKGYPTPKPVAYLENRLGPLRGNSYFVYEFVEGRTFKELATGLKNHRLLRDFVCRLVDIWKIQLEIGVNLTDGHPANFIVDPTGKFWVIDLDKLQYLRHDQEFVTSLRRSFLHTVGGVIGDKFVLRFAREKIDELLAAAAKKAA